MAAPAVGEVDKPAERGILMKGRPVGTNQLQRSKRREGSIRGLGRDGGGIHGMTVEYLHGPVAVRLSRKCSRQRDHAYRSETKLDRDVGYRRGSSRVQGTWVHYLMQRGGAPTSV